MSFIGTEGLSDLFLARLTPPPKRLTHYDFSKVMRLPDGPQAGQKWDAATEPAQLHFINAVSCPWHRIFVYVAPSQRGKTLAAVLFPWLYSVTEEGLPVGYVMPNLDKLTQNWMGKIKPAIVGSGFGDWLPAKGPGSKSGKPAALELQSPDGRKKTVTYFMAGGTGARETSLSSVSPARLVIDEADDFESAGHIDLALKRLESWGHTGRAFIASTVNSKAKRTSHPVLDMFNRYDATKSRVAHKCPHCQAFQVITEEQFQIEERCLVCISCGVKWSEDDRHEALNSSQLVGAGQSIVAGKISGEPLRLATFSLLTTGFDYHMADFGILAATWQAALEREKIGDFSLIENFQHKVLCKHYEIPPDQQSITDRMLTLRSSTALDVRGVVPDGFTRIVVAVDVQADRMYWLAMAADENDNRAIIDWDEWYYTTHRAVEPTADDRHKLLERILHRCRDGWPRNDGSILKGSIMGIDIGYNPGGSIGKWIANRAGCIALRGDSERRVQAETIDGKKITLALSRASSQLEADHGFYEVRKQQATPDSPAYWWFVRTQSLREHLASRLRMTPDTDGALRLPRGLAQDDQLIRHLSSWHIIRDKETNICRWEQKGKRDDLLDCGCYALAMLTIQKKAKQPRNGKIISESE